MSVSLWPVVVDRLITVWSALTITSPGGGTILVCDGQPVGWQDITHGLAVGVDGAYPEGNSGRFEQEWRDAGPAPYAARQETGEIVCTLWRTTGETTMSALRTGVFSDLAAIWDAVASVAVIDARLVDLRIMQGDPMQQQTPAGALFELPFRLRYVAII